MKGSIKPDIKTIQVCLEYVPEFGGSAVAARAYAEAMESAVIAFTSKDHMRHTQGWDEDVFRIPIRSDFLGRKYALPGSKSALHQANSLLYQSDLAVIHVLYRYHIQWAGNALRRMKIPYWVVPHGSLDPWVFTYRALTKRIWLKMMGNRILRRAQVVIFVTERERQKASPYTQGCKTQVIHLPVEYVDVSKKDKVRAEIRYTHGIPQDDRILIWVGRLHPMKRPMETIEAFGKRYDSSLHLMMIGPDDALTKKDCEHYCSEHNIRNVHLMGSIYGSRKYDYYMAADGYISLSHRENFNYTAAEALACGLPVILSKGNDLSFALKNQKCGWILKADGSREAADTIGQFASVPRPVLCNMGVSGQQWARTSLSWETFVQAIGQLAVEST